MRDSIQSIQLRHFLSYHEMEPFELSPLNVLVGPNGSGKSNLIEAFALLQSLPRDVRPAVSRGGGVDEWIHKRHPGGPASIAITHAGSNSGTHTVSLTSSNGLLEVNETFEGFPQATPAGGIVRRSDQSVLTLLRGPQYPTQTSLANFYGSLRVYRNWIFGQDASEAIATAGLAVRLLGRGRL